jgi:hypothetical protein
MHLIPLFALMGVVMATTSTLKVTIGPNCGALDGVMGQLSSLNSADYHYFKSISVGEDEKTITFIAVRSCYIVKPNAINYMNQACYKGDYKFVDCVDS